MTLAQASSPAFSLAIIGTVSSASGIYREAVGGILLSSIRRQLLTGVSMIYAINATTGMTTDTLVNRLQDSVTSGAFLDSMIEKSGLPITGVSGLILLNTSPTPFPTQATLHTPSGTDTLRILKINTVGFIPSIH